MAICLQLAAVAAADAAGDGLIIHVWKRSETPVVVVVVVVSWLLGVLPLQAVLG